MNRYTYVATFTDGTTLDVIQDDGWWQLEGVIGFYPRLADIKSAIHDGSAHPTGLLGYVDRKQNPKWKPGTSKPKPETGRIITRHGIRIRFAI